MKFSHLTYIVSLALLVALAPCAWADESMWLTGRSVRMAQCDASHGTLDEWLTYYNEEPEPVPDSSTVDRLLAYAHRFLGTPYRYGGQGPKTFDCAGFTRYVFRLYGFSLPPSAGGQYRVGTRLPKDSLLRPGDLVFYGDRHKHSFVGHVGLVVSVDSATGRFRFIHASTSLGVIVSASGEAYYAKRYIGACRLLADEAWMPVRSPEALRADSAARAEQLQRLADSVAARAAARADSVRTARNLRLRYLDALHRQSRSRKVPQQWPESPAMPVDETWRKPRTEVGGQ